MTRKHAANNGCTERFENRQRPVLGAGRGVFVIVIALSAIAGTASRGAARSRRRRVSAMVFGT